MLIFSLPEFSYLYLTKVNILSCIIKLAVHIISSNRPKIVGLRPFFPSLVRWTWVKLPWSTLSIDPESDPCFSNHTSTKGGVQGPQEAIRASGFKVSRSISGIVQLALLCLGVKNNRLSDLLSHGSPLWEKRLWVTSPHWLRWSNISGCLRLAGFLEIGTFSTKPRKIPGKLRQAHHLNWRSAPMVSGLRADGPKRNKHQ